jgi:hypothetical protein
MNSLNRQRTNIVYAHYRATGTILTPAEVAKRERIFAAGSVIFDRNGMVLGRCEIGRGLTDFCLTRDRPDGHSWPQAILRIFALEEYILWINLSSSSRHHYCISLTRESNTSDQIKAWIHAIELLHLINEPGSFPSGMDEALIYLEKSLKIMNNTNSQLLPALAVAGWDMHNGALLTRPSFRLRRVHDEGGNKKTR